jgi:hypothetical protein
MDASVDQETKLLKRYDYACNKHNNGPTRPLNQILWKKANIRHSLVDLINEHLAQDLEEESAFVDQITALLGGIDLAKKDRILEKARHPKNDIERMPPFEAKCT